MESRGRGKTDRKQPPGGEGEAIMKKMEYQQVKERVEREDKALKRIVIETGIGMLIALLAAILVFG